MKKDIVLHSDCPFLLMRMFTDLQIDGRFDDDLGWNSRWNPMDTWCNYLFISKKLAFHNHDCHPIKLIPLTETNYLETLKMILE